MGTIICQTCEKTIAQYEDEKVSTLYGVCPNCNSCQHQHTTNREIKKP